MKRLTICAAALLTGCANYGEYYKSVEASNTAMVAAVRAQAEADAVRFNVLMRIAESGDATAKVAATMALALGGQRSAQAPAVAAQPQNEALQWASVVVPGVTQGLMGYYSMRTNMRQSDNSTALGMSTNATMLGMGELMAKDPLVVTQPAPVVVTQPEPVIVEQPAPIIVTQPEPIIQDPIVVTPPDPIVVRPEPPVIVRPEPPVIVNPPDPIIVVPPDPIIVNPPAPTPPTTP